MRNFATDDSIVLGQLRELERLAGQDCREGSFHVIDILIRAVLRTLKALPEGIASRIRTNFYVGDSYAGASDAERSALWTRLSKGLAEDLDRLAADQALVGVDIGKRPKTKGEEILVVCGQLEDARSHGGDMLSLARALERVGAGTDAGFDGSELIRLLSKKRIPDYAKHQAEIVRRIYHARIVAERFHNQPADDFY